jgi:hypothetical protein
MSIPNITAAHAAMPQQGPANLGASFPATQRATNPGAGNPGTATGNPVFTSGHPSNPVLTTMQSANPNVIPNPSIEQIQTISKALKMLNNHQLLMKFATENKQVCQSSSSHFYSAELTFTQVYSSCPSLLGENRHSAALVETSITGYGSVRGYSG